MVGTAAVMIALAVFLTGWLSRAYTTWVEEQLVQSTTRLAADPELITTWEAGTSTLTPYVLRLAGLMDAEVTALRTDGAVVAGSHPGAMQAEMYTTLPEVRAALNGETGQSRRARDDGEWLLFTATPVRKNGVAVGVLQVTYSLGSLMHTISEIQRVVLASCALAALALAALLVGHTEQTARDVRKLTAMITAIRRGDFNARVLSIRGRETGELALALNMMADELQSQMKKRAREKDRLNTVLHVMTDGVVILNKAGEVRLLNPAAAQQLNTQADHALGRSFIQVVRDHRIAEVWLRCQHTGVEEIAAVELGPAQFMRVIVTPFLKRAARGYLVMLQDLSEVRKLQTIRQDFISNVSHELRTPLASLRALVETLRDGALDDPPAAHRFLDRMEVEVDALTQMVEELLELSRIESGQVPLRLIPVHPAAVVTPGVDRLRPQAERHGITLMVDAPPDLPVVLADAQRIQQVIANLVHNAIKFTPAGGSVAVHAGADGRWVRIEVEDTGIGIPAADLPRIFERFYKADRSRAQGGTGLGLAIAKHIVQAHGGEIWAQSVEGDGSVFTFTLPVAETPPDKDAPLPAGAEPRPPAELAPATLDVPALAAANGGPKPHPSGEAH